MHLRPIDLSILRELMRWEGNQPEGALRFPVRDLARRTRAHPNTVRARLAALRRSGVVEGAFFDPWPRILGLVRAGWMFHGVRPGGVEATAKVLAEFPSINGAAIGLDWLFAHIWEPDDAAAAACAKALGRRLGATRYLRHFTSTDFPASPADRLTLTPLDWRLVLALRRNPTRSLAAVAKELGSTPRSVERRAARLYRTGAGGMFPMLRLSRIEGLIFVHYLLTKGDERAAGSLAKAFPERLAGPWGRGINTGVMVPLTSAAQVDLRRREAERLPGVGALEVLIYTDLVFSPVFNTYLERRVASSQVAVAPTIVEKRPTSPS